MRRCFAPLLALGSVFAAAPLAHGDPGDLALNRLSYYNAAAPGQAPQYVFAGGCGTSSTLYAQCIPDNQLFANLVNELGSVMAPALMAPAGTMGPNGLYVGYEPSVTRVNGDDPTAYWHRGTVGTPATLQGGAMGTASVVDRVPGVLFVSHIHVRKSFPMGFELGLQTAFLHDSGMIALGADIRWSLLEGFRTGIARIPDMAIRGAVSTLVGNSQLYLTVASADASISEKLTLGGMANLTPYLGGQALFIFGDSTVIDGTPARSSYGECPRRHVEFTGQPNMPGVPVSGSNPPASSSLVCDATSTTTTAAPGMGVNDSQNEMVFMSTRIVRARAFGGLQLRFGPMVLTGEFNVDLIDPQWLQGTSSVAGQGRPDATGTQQAVTLTNFRQWTATLGVGAMF